LPLLGSVGFDRSVELFWATNPGYRGVAWAVTQVNYSTILICHPPETMPLAVDLYENIIDA
jgi:hypothetical protein